MGCEHSDPGIDRFAAHVFRDGELVWLYPIDGVDITQWHDYKIDLLEQSTNFYIDGVLVTAAPRRPTGPQRIEIWIDNRAIVGGDIIELPVEIDESMEIDRVAIS